MIFISDNEFSNVVDATNVGSVASNSFLITPETFSSLSNERSWWLVFQLKMISITAR